MGFNSAFKGLNSLWLNPKQVAVSGENLIFSGMGTD